MYIAYSVLHGQTAGAAPLAETEQTGTVNSDKQLRYQAYQDICHKYRLEIAAIQKYIPGWLPNLPTL